MNLKVAPDSSSLYKILIEERRKLKSLYLDRRAMHMNPIPKLVLPHDSPLAQGFSKTTQKDELRRIESEILSAEIRISILKKSLKKMKKFGISEQEIEKKLQEICADYGKKKKAIINVLSIDFDILNHLSLLKKAIKSLKKSKKHIDKVA